MALKRQKVGAATIYEGALRCHSFPPAVRLQEPRQPMTFWVGARLTGRYVPDIPSRMNRDGCFFSNLPQTFYTCSILCVEPSGCVTQKGSGQEKKKMMCRSEKTLVICISLAVWDKERKCHFELRALRAWLHGWTTAITAFKYFNLQNIVAKLFVDES